MATETKIGLLLIVVLLGAFGFVIYKKIDKQNENTAKTITPNDRRPDSNSMFGGQGSTDEAFKLDPEHHHAGLASVNDDRRNGTNGDLLADAGHNHGDHQHKTAQAPPPPEDTVNPFTADLPAKTKAPVKRQPVVDDLNAFNDLSAQSEPAPAPKKSEKKGVQRDDFGSPLETGWSQDMGPGKHGASNSQQPKITPKQTPMAPAPAPKRIADGFDPVAASKKPGGQTFAEDRPSPNDDIKLFEDEVKAKGKSLKLKPGPNAHAGTLHDDMTGSPDWNDTAEAPPPKNPQTPKTRASADDPFNNGGRFHEDPQQPKRDGWNQHADGHHHHDVDDEALDSERADVYVVESGDNYWSISRKKYGTARYFTALARFNERRIPDPKAMRPGMKVLVPDPQRLAALFPHLVGQKSQVVQASGDDDGSHCGVQPAGFFVTQDGRPMYRIGKQDTLTEIAKRHLGRSSRWIQVFKLNQDRLTTPNDLKIGTELVLPSDASQVQVVSEPLEYR